ncbi:biliverdin-producing heme oxygenase [Deinococcus sedimenti]|uniref:Heme oxygenase n=1 Tax=Deinococcus sedimenti TaxID=1867090 RepID=A0ABQ2S650_9DEIO|nr:biliverdin-producing heme oxygenase [Deinococcus sedimenti]GGR92184.1 heme oxygenase [Deinococcus sedimenti]
MTVASSSEPTLLARLRTDTRPQHEQAESALNLLHPGLTRPRYAAVLARLHARHAQLEPRLDETLGAVLPADLRAALDLPGRAKAGLLARDLAALGHAPHPEPIDLTWLRSEAQAWGAAYVLEGATLGGQVVTRHLRRAGFTPDTLHYYGSYGADVATRWRTFGALLTARHAAAADPRAFADAATDAARRVFTVFTLTPPMETA